MSSSRDINQRGIGLVVEQLTAIGGQARPTGDRGVHVFFRSTPDDQLKGVAVHAKLKALPAAGKGPKALDWWMNADTQADLHALVDLSTKRVWLLTAADVKRLAQQHPGNRHHLYMYVEKVGRTRHPHSRVRDFEDFLVSPTNDALRERVSRRPVSATLDESLVAVEGELHTRLVAHRHRERWLRHAKITKVLETSGKLCCEVPGCGFDFLDRYGEIGKGYAQVHHLRQLSLDDAPMETRLEDLAIVCANCHAMIHRDGGNRALADLIPASE